MKPERVFFVEPIPQGVPPVLDFLDLKDEQKIYMADVGDFVQLEQALSKINEEWLEEWSCHQTTLDLARACRELLRRS
jgi:hypothetical protein